MISARNNSTHIATESWVEKMGEAPGLGDVRRQAHFTPPKPRFKIQVIGNVMC